MLIGREITVAGGGIAGLAAGAALAMRGAAVEICERAAEFGEVGAGLQISPNGVAVIDALGQGEALRAKATRIDHLRMFDHRGALVVTLDFARHAAGRDFLALHRADLVEVLRAAAVAAGARLSTGREIADVQIAPDGPRFSKGGPGENGFLVGADGLASRVRAALNGPETPFFTGQVAWRALVPGGGGNEVHLHMGPGCHVVSYPLRGGTLTNIVAVETRADWVDEDWHQAGDPARMRQRFAVIGGEVPALLERVDQVKVWGLFRHPVAARWMGPGTALVGDAAHPTLPFMAQGANLALEDAWVLADCLGRAASEQDALALYQARRRDRALRVIAAANANARNYHLANPALRLAAHSALRLAGTAAPARLVARFGWIWNHDVTATAGG